MKNLEQILDTVKNIVYKTGQYALRHKKEAVIKQKKEKNDFATNIDLYCEKYLIDNLRTINSKFSIYSEELNSENMSRNKIYWVIDPIDGTKNYFRNNPLWSVNVALFDAKNNNILIGVVYFPELDKLFYAANKLGAFENGKKISVSNKEELSEAMIYVDLPNSKHHKFINNFLFLLKDVYKIRSWGIGSSICFIANGAFDGFIDFSGTTKAYDIYAALLIAKEAGASMSLLKKGKYKDTIIWVTNSKISFNKYL